MQKDVEVRELKKHIELLRRKLKEAALLLMAHHEISYRPVWGRNCKICQDKRSDIFTEIETVMKVTETIYQTELKTQEQPRRIMHIKKTVVIHDNESNFQAIYVDGVLAGHDSTIFAHNITDAVGGPDIPFTLEQRNYDDVGDEDWPSSLVELEERVRLIESVTEHEFSEGDL
jgi:hypothetical protein